MTRRTTLRPIETPVAPPAPPASPTLASPPRTPVNPVVIGGVVAFGLLIVGALMFMANRPNATPAVTPAPEVAAPIAIPAPTCPAVTSFLDVIGSYERQAKWGMAASTAQTALRTPTLCEADRGALGQKLVSLSREALFEQPPAPEDAPGQRRVVTAYTDLKSMASQYGIQPPAPLPIAQSAYDNRLFLLATAAYADAFANGDTSADDRSVVRADYAAQYNLGLSWAHRSDASQRQDGLARLATACRISEQHQLASPEACNDLQTLVGTRAPWPAPLADPFIGGAASRH